MMTWSTIAILVGAAIALTLVMFGDCDMPEPHLNVAVDDQDFAEFYMDLLTYDDFTRQEALGIYAVWKRRAAQEPARID